jgi:dipeptidyl aminopeptidase/acylaminoacyl peptidase
MNDRVRAAMIVLVAWALVAAAPSPRLELTVDGIMRGPKLVGYPPTGLRWSGDSRELYFEWRHAGEDEPSTWVVAREGGEPRRLSDEERKKAPAADAVWDEAHRRAISVDDGDVVMVDSVARTRRQVTRTTEKESSPHWARRESHVSFLRGNDVYLVPLEAAAGDLVVQLTDVSLAKAEPKPTEGQTFLKEEEQKLIGHVREAAEKKKKEEEKKKKAALPKLEVKEGQSVSDAALAPDDDHVYLIVAEKSDRAKTAQVPNYVTESAYTEEIASRTKVGDVQEKRRLAILNRKSGKSVWASADFAGNKSAEAAEKPSQQPAETAEKPSEPAEKLAAGLREVRWSLPAFSRDGAFAVTSARSADNKDRWLVLVDPETGASRVLDHVHDDAWVHDASDGLGFLPDDRRIWFLSERDGWMHLYTVDASRPGAEATPLTSGRWEVTQAELSPDRRKIYFASTEAGPAERHVYAVSVDGGPRTRLTTAPGASEGEASPDEKTLALIHSEVNQPPDVYLAPNRPGGEPRRITTSSSEEWRSYPWRVPPLVTYKARDGAEVTARLYTPEMVGAKRDPLAPGAVFVHGAGYLQNAHRYWSSYYREYMFHHLLASRGYVVLDPDYRGSAGYGRDWRVGIYRHMGGHDLEDVVDGARYLAAAQRVDPGRIGVYGGSYGGFITLMAMFTTPDVFAAGAALRPVTDWAHYNHSYTSGILNEPARDPEAYRRSSPIYFAEGLKGALLICHGMVDTNVHFQDSVRLAQRLIELRKENWELAAYPVENHAFEEETSWADEYKRILELFEQHLRGQRPPPR